MKTIENNIASVTGYFTSEFVFSHEMFGEKFYLVDLECERLSGAKDVIPMMVEIPSVIVDGYGIRDGDQVEWTYFINCKNQKKATLKYEYKGF